MTAPKRFYQATTPTEKLAVFIIIDVMQIAVFFSYLSTLIFPALQHPPLRVSSVSLYKTWRVYLVRPFFCFMHLLAEALSQILYPVVMSGDHLLPSMRNRMVMYPTIPAITEGPYTYLSSLRASRSASTRSSLSPSALFSSVIIGRTLVARLLGCLNTVQPDLIATGMLAFSLNLSRNKKLF